MYMYIKNYLNGFCRAYPLFISAFLFLFGMIFQSNISIYFLIYLIILGTIIVKNLKKIFKYIYNYLDLTYIPILGIGSRPENAKYCSCFISENNLEGIPNSFGMPSGHSIIAMTISIFTTFYILDNYPDNFRRKISLIVLNILGLLICLSRIWLNCHTIQQVILGGSFGILSGFYSYKLWLFINSITKLSI